MEPAHSDFLAAHSGVELSHKIVEVTKKDGEKALVSNTSVA
jgi:hypothetical protein